MAMTCIPRGLINLLIGDIGRMGGVKKSNKVLNRPISTTAKKRLEERDGSLYKFKNPFARDFGKYEKVKLGTVSAIERKIPDHIKKPDYWKSGLPMGLEPTVIEIKSQEAIIKMRNSCALARQLLNATVKQIKVGMTTEDIDDFVFNYTIEHGAYPSPLNYRNFPKSVCTSVNNVACHGIPDNRRLLDGDIINIDVMVYIDGYHGDCSTTVLVGNVDEMGRKLVDAAKACLRSRCDDMCSRSTIHENRYCRGKRVYRGPCFTGHGIGSQIHCKPDIYHIDFPYSGTMEIGQTFTIEPVLTQGMENIVVLEDGWTAVTLDGARTAQFEHTICITDYGVEILTLPENNWMKRVMHITSNPNK